MTKFIDHQQRASVLNTNKTGHDSISGRYGPIPHKTMATSVTESGRANVTKRGLTKHNGLSMSFSRCNRQRSLPDVSLRAEDSQCPPLNPGASVLNLYFERIMAAGGELRPLQMNDVTWRPRTHCVIWIVHFSEPFVQVTLPPANAQIQAGERNRNSETGDRRMSRPSPGPGTTQGNISAEK
jgi:hypothetical protein